MSMRRLKRLGYSTLILERLAKYNIHTVKDLLSRTPVELMKLAELSYTDVQSIQLTASQAVTPQCQSGLQLWKDQKKEKPCYLPTTLPDLDKVLHGGIPVSTITEIAGPSGCGKTQLSVMLSVLATLPRQHGGFGGSVLYIDTECAFSAERNIILVYKTVRSFSLATISMLRDTCAWVW